MDASRVRVSQCGLGTAKGGRPDMVRAEEGGKGRLTHCGDFGREGSLDLFEVCHEGAHGQLDALRAQARFLSKVTVAEHDANFFR